MDHRWYERWNIRFSVAIHDASIGLIIGNTRDISQNGMFIELPDIYIDEDEELELSFAIPFSGKTKPERIRAEVVHRAVNGIGLRLKEYEFQTDRLSQ